MDIKYRANAYFVTTERRIWWSGDSYSEPNTEDEIFFALVFAHTEKGARTIFKRAGVCPYGDGEPLAVIPITEYVNRPIGIASDDDKLWMQTWDVVYRGESEANDG